jgi:hypothetical protein
MARAPKITPAADEPRIDEAKLADALAQHRADEGTRELALTKQNERVTALARQLNYSGSTDPAVLENSAKDAIKRIGMGIFELGGYLLLMKDACGPGKFLPALERLGMEPRAAQRYMAITKRFVNASTSTHLERAGMSKLVELLPLDDEQIKDLSELGQTGELALDDVAGMSVKELRAAVRKERGLVAKRESQIDRLKTVNDDLQEETRLIKHAKPDEARARLHTEAAEVLNETLGLVRGNLRAALMALNNEGDERGANAILMAGMVGQVQAELLALRDEFSLRDVIGDGKPEWQTWAEAQDAAAKSGKSN